MILEKYVGSRSSGSSAGGGKGANGPSASPAMSEAPQQFGPRPSELAWVGNGPPEKNGRENLPNRQ